MTLRRPRLTEWVAIVLLALAIVGYLTWLLADVLDDWAPNVATEALSIAVTVAIVERVIRREAEARIRPRLESAMEEVADTVGSLAAYVALEYVHSHAGEVEIPHEIGAILDLDAGGIDPAPSRLGQEQPWLIAEAERASERLHRIRELDADLLEPRLVVAMDELASELQQVRFLHDLTRTLGAKDEELRRGEAAGRVVDSLKAFLAVYAEIPGAKLTLDTWHEELVVGAGIVEREASRRGRRNE